MSRTLSRADVIRAAAPRRLTYRTLATLIATGLLTDVSDPTAASKHPRFDPAEVQHLFELCPPIDNLPHPYLRVSLTATDHDPIYTADLAHTPVRDWLGYDHHNRHSLTTQQRLHAITATWPVNTATADRIVDDHIPIIGTVAGFTLPDMATYATGWVHTTNADGTAPLRVAFTPDTTTPTPLSIGSYQPIPPGTTAQLVE